MEFISNEAEVSGDSGDDDNENVSHGGSSFIDDSEIDENTAYPNPYLTCSHGCPEHDDSRCKDCTTCQEILEQCTCPGDGFFDPECPLKCFEKNDPTIKRIQRKIPPGRTLVDDEEIIIRAESRRIADQVEFIQNFKESKKKTSPRKPKHYCKDCDVKCYSDNYWETHINSKRHKDNQPKPSTSTADNNPIKKSPKRKINFSDKIINCECCQKDISDKNWKRHIASKNHKKNEKQQATTYDENDPNLETVDDDDDEKKKKNRGGQLFVVQFQKACKYRVCKKVFAAIRCGMEWINGIAISNEWGALADFPNGHSHMLIRTVEALTFEEFKSSFFELTGIECDDVQRARNLRTVLRYITKEDYKSIVIGFDQDLTSSLYKCYHYARVARRLDWTRYPCCNIAPIDKKNFESQYYEFFEMNKHDALKSKMEGVILRDWQNFVIQHLQKQETRKVTWIIDYLGNTGKSFLAEYFQNSGAFIIIGGSKRDIAYAYNEEKNVIFDLPREDKEKMDYALLECFKNGWLWCPKYHSRLKRFDPPNILVLANWEPLIDKLSIDRWDIFQLAIDILLPIDPITLQQQQQQQQRKYHHQLPFFIPFPTMYRS